MLVVFFESYYRKLVMHHVYTICKISELIVEDARPRGLTGDVIISAELYIT